VGSTDKKKKKKKNKKEKMKLTKLLILFASCANGTIISTKYGSSALTNMNDLNVKFAVTTTFNDNLDLDLNVSSSSPVPATEEELACLKEEQSYAECLMIVEISDDTCKLINEEKCSKFYNDPISAMPSCGKIDQNQKDVLTHLIKVNGNSFKLYCFNNIKCPIAQDMILFTTGNYGNSYQWTSPETRKKGYIPSQEIISENCKIPECSSKSIDLFTEIIAFNEALTKKVNETPEKINQKIEDILKSMGEQSESLNKAINELKKCNGSSTSNVTKNNIGNIIIDSITLLAIFLFYNY
jgi:hypothetical protein